MGLKNPVRFIRFIRNLICAFKYLSIWNFELLRWSYCSISLLHSARYRSDIVGWLSAVQVQKEVRDYNLSRLAILANRNKEKTRERDRSYLFSRNTLRFDGH